LAIILRSISIPTLVWATRGIDEACENALHIVRDRPFLLVERHDRPINTQGLCGIHRKLAIREACGKNGHGILPSRLDNV